MTQVWNLVTVGEQFTAAKVGDGATVLHYTDRTACTVIAVSASGKTATLREDAATRTDANGMCDSQTYAYEPDADGQTFTARLGKRGWKANGQRVWMGVRDKHHDFGF